MHPLLKLCRDFTTNQNDAAGKEAVSYLSKSAEVPGDIAQECLELLLQHQKKANVTLDSTLVDRIVTGILRECLAARTYLGKQLDASAATVFGEYYELGDGSANALASVVLDVSAWKNEVARDRCEKDVFQLFLAKLMEVGHDYDGKALKGIARLLATDPERLHGFVDEETFDAVLASLDHRNSLEVRSQATLTTAKYLEASQDDGQRYLINFIQTRVKRQKNDDLILAFSAAAAVFPVAPSMAASFFLTDGFVPSLIPLLQKKAKSDKVEQAALEMLSAACIDSGCRQSIQKHCTQWLQQVLNSDNEQSKNLAAVTLAKVQSPGDRPSSSTTEDDEDQDDDLVARLKTMMISAGPNTLQNSIEGLAHASTTPEVKERLAYDRAFLGRLFEAVKRARPGSTTAFGALSLINNLTCYLPNLTEEQQRLAQLKAYANATPSSAAPSPLDSNDAVTKRCDALLSAGVVPALVSIWKTLSTTTVSLLVSILLSLSFVQRNRHILARDGAARLVLHISTSLPGTDLPSLKTRYTAANGLARILASIEPSHVFPRSGSPPLSSTIRPLITLFTNPDPDASTRDSLPIFESLLALTNIIAAAPTDPIIETIIRLAQAHIEELLLSNLARIRRACTELICNLVSNSTQGIELFAADTQNAKHYLHILLALSGSDDTATRAAAGGALAAITTMEQGVRNVLGREAGVKRVLEMCEDEDEGIKVRGVVVLSHILQTEEGSEAVKKEEGFEEVKRVVQKAMEKFEGKDDIDELSMAGEAVRMLEDQ